MTPSEKPILFSGPMVRAILEGRKTQTRRAVKKPANVPPEDFRDACEWMQRHGKGSVLKRGPCDGVQWRLPCPYGAAGTRLWVRETWAVGRAFDRTRPSEIPTVERDLPVWWQADGAAEESVNRGRWRPSLHMPRWASRITLDVVSVRVERLQAITGPGILAEGAVARPHDDPLLGRCPVSAFDGCAYPDLMSLWRAGWDSINGKRPGCSWDDDPWVWVVEFRRRPGAIAKENQP